MKKYHKILLILSLFICTVIYAQEGSVDNNYVPKIFLNSPQASSLGKVGEIPIDISTGRKKFNIPIFEINQGDISFPIELYYNYNGLLIDETPGYGGVGWTFNIGGYLTKQVKGLPDDASYQNKELIDRYPNQMTVEEQLSLLKQIDRGTIDGEPDKFIMNLGTINCSFYLDKNNNPVFLKNENYKVVPIQPQGSLLTGYKIIDDNGIEYTFDVVENVFDTNTNNDYISSWQISKIYSPKTNQQVIFEYQDGGFYDELSKSQTKIIEYDILGHQIGNNIRTNNQISTIYKKDLKKIITKDYEIEISYVNNPVESAIKVISSVEIKRQNNIVKRYDFIYTPWAQRRTVLTEVKYNNATTHTMEYFTGFPTVAGMPGNLSLKKDLWGFYSTLINLKPNFEDTKIGALKKITYQTKGYSLIEYEPNKIYMNSNEYNFPFEADENIINSLQSQASNGSTQSNNFVLTTGREVSINYNFSHNSTYYDDKLANVVILDANNNVSFSKSYNCAWENRWICTNNGNALYGSDSVYLMPGTYTIKATTTSGINASIAISYIKENYSFHQTIGGIRVKETQNCDFDNNCITTKYNYTESNISTGIMLQNPQYYSGYKIIDKQNCTALPASDSYIKYNYYNKANIYPLSVFGGSPVLYKRVEQYQEGVGNHNGKIINFFNANTNNGRFLEYDLLSIGILDKSFIINLDNDILEHKKNQYSSLLVDQNKFVRWVSASLIKETYHNVFTCINCTPGCAKNTPELVNYKTGGETLRQHNYKLIQSESKQYFNNNILSISNFDFNINGQLTRTQTTTSTGETLTQKFYYPHDLLSQGVMTTQMQELITANRIATPIKTETYTDNVQTSETFTKYAKNTLTGNLLLPTEIHSIKGEGDIDPNNSANRKITYTLYDTDNVGGQTLGNGNILEYKLENGIPVAIIWGYNKQYPIAKVEGATYAQIQSSVANLQALSNADNSTAAEDALQTALELFITNNPNYMITTYVYDPLVGVKRITSPDGSKLTYEYDSFGRLYQVKDKQGRVLSENEYHYKNEQ